MNAADETWAAFQQNFFVGWAPVAIFIMATAGFALFYAGMVRKKNVTHTILQINVGWTLAFVVYFLIGFPWRVISPVGEYIEGFRNSRIGLSVIGIYADSLFEIFDTSLDTLLCSLVPVIAPLEVRIIRAGIDPPRARLFIFFPWS